MRERLRTRTKVQQPARKFIGLRRLVTVCVLLFAVMQPARAVDDPALRDADLRDYIAFVAERTGRNFIVDPRVQGRVSIVGEQPEDPDALYRLFVSVLQVHGYTPVQTEGITKIVPSLVGKTLGQPDEAGRYAGERTVTEVFRLRYLTVAELVPTLQPLLAPEAHIARDIGSNSIVIADSLANIERIAFIIRALDRPLGIGAEVIALAHADAEEVARQLSAVVPRDMAAQVKPPQPAVADARGNKVIINGTREERLLMRALAAQLDLPVELGSGIAVVYLKHASAGDLVETLRDVARRLTARNQGRAPVAGSAAPAGEPHSAAAQVGGIAAGQPLRVLADEATNAIVLQGAPPRIAELRATIEALDVPRAQVYVEAIVAEVSATRTAELGIQWRTGNPADGVLAGSILPGTEAGNIQTLNGASPTLGSGLALGYVEGGTVRALLRALAADQSTNVLSTPTLVTMDNEEAEIQVGQNVPLLIGQYTTTSSGDGVTNPFQTVERRDVGVRLKVKPQITLGDLVRLTVEQELSALSPSSVAADLILDKRAIKTDVIVQDNQTIVIGGLLSEDVRQSTQKVPVAGDVPVVGNAARDRRSDLTHTNLLVFLSARVVRNAGQVVDLTRRSRDGLRERRAEPPPDRVPLLPGESIPRIP